MDANQTKIFTAILLAALTIGGILVYFIIILINQQRRNSKLYQSKIQAEITTLENERMRFSSDLHDELGPLLSAVKFKLSSIDITDPDDEQQMAESNKYLDDIIVRMRQIAGNLMPTSLLKKGLIYAIKEFAQAIPSTTGLSIQISHNELPPLEKETTINIYRILQEIIHNTLKHAEASLLKIELKYEDDKVIILTRDNGKGFDYHYANKENTGLGLRNLLSRTDIMRGNLYIDSKKNKGTEYLIELPVN